MLKKLLWILISLVILTALLWTILLIAQYFLMEMAVSQIDKDNRYLRQQASQGMHNSECSTSTDPDLINPVKYQLRFISPVDYVLESVCFEAPNKGYEFARRNLPFMVSRTGGIVGYTAYEPVGLIQLSVFQLLQNSLPTEYQSWVSWLVAKKDINIQDNRVSVSQDTQDLPVWSEEGVQSSCQAFGYLCCDETGQVGQGKVLDDTIDCKGRCYTSCVNRPLVLAFGADGGFDPNSRTVEVIGGGSVNFSYIGEAGSRGISQVVLDFGDGQTQNLAYKNEQVPHTYECRQTSCQFVATLSLVDADGNTSPISPLTKLKIVIRQ